MTQMEPEYVASVADRALKGVSHEWLAVEHAKPESGWVVLAEVLSENARYGLLELGTGETIRLKPGMRIAGALGARKASRAYGGRVPDSILTGDTLHLLNLGGVIGELESEFEDLGTPVALRILGVAHADGAPLTLKRNAIPMRESLDLDLPLIAVCGTAMNVGKTTTVVQLSRALSEGGYAVFAVKAAGVACLKDACAFSAAGARDARGFWDCGLPSTVGVSCVPEVIKGLFAEMLERAAFPDRAVGIVELGDGLLGHYGGIQFFLDPDLRDRLRACVLCANDWVGVYGARSIFRAFGIPHFFVTGMVAESAVGSPLLRVPFCNIRTNPDPLVEWTIRRLTSPDFCVREGSRWPLSTASAF
ncbi:MAG: nucleotide-binding protein [bacterium JZ-2024 1]